MTIQSPTLRPYQQQLADDVRLAYKMGHRCPLVVASTGMGKTILFSYITFNASARGNAVIVAAHRKEIIRQISMSLAKFGVEHEVIAPPKLRRVIIAAQFKAFGRSFVKMGARVMVGSVQTLVTRFDLIDSILDSNSERDADGKVIKRKAPLIIMDEGHHVVEDTQWGRVMDRYHVEVEGRALIVTASPERLDGRGLGKGFGGFADTMIEAPPMSWAIANGFLSPYRALTAPQQIDVAGVAVRRGDYVTAELAERVDKPSITGDAIAHWQQHANGLRAVAFCVSVEHARHVADEFTAAGIPAAYIDGDMDDDQRDRAIIGFAEGRVQVLTNVNIVSEGFDLASIAQMDVTIDCLIDLAPTQSLINYMQRVGRALRPAPGKVAVLLDHAGNILRHGLPDDHREWSLEGRKKRGKKADNDNEGEDAVRICPACRSYHRPWEKRTEDGLEMCPHDDCGHVYPPAPEKQRKVEQQDGDLVELSAEQIEAMRRQKRAMQGQAKTVPELIAQGISRGRAIKIVAAREAKQDLIASLVANLEAAKAASGKSTWEEFGIRIADVSRMKPKQLHELIAKTAQPFRVSEAA